MVGFRGPRWSFLIFCHLQKGKRFTGTIISLDRHATKLMPTNVDPILMTPREAAKSKPENYISKPHIFFKIQAAKTQKLGIVGCRLVLLASNLYCWSSSWRIWIRFFTEAWARIHEEGASSCEKIIIMQHKNQYTKHHGFAAASKSHCGERPQECNLNKKENALF